MAYSVTTIWPDKVRESTDFGSLKELKRHLPDLIRQFGRDSVLPFDNQGRFLAYEDLDLDDDLFDIEEDRYPELFIELHNGHMRVYREGRHLLSREISDLPERFQDPDNLDELYEYVKTMYDDSLIDIYYLQK